MVSACVMACVLRVSFLGYDGLAVGIPLLCSYLLLHFSIKP